MGQQPPDFSRFPSFGKKNEEQSSTSSGAEERTVSLYNPRQPSTLAAGTSPSSPFSGNKPASPFNTDAKSVSPFGSQQTLGKNFSSPFSNQQQSQCVSPLRSTGNIDRGYRTPGQPLGSAAQNMSARPTSAFRPLGQKSPEAPMPSLRSFTRGTLGQESMPQLRPSQSPLGAKGAGQTGMPRTASLFRKDLQISDEEFLLLRDFIYQQCGIFIAENRKYLVENRLSNRIKELNLKSYTEYYNFLRFDASRNNEMNKLFEVVTTNETSFFRNPPQLDVFQKVVLAQAIEQCRKSGRKKIRIWSAGCSTGEEPYTLAIILHESLKSDIANWDIKITANDLSAAVLKAAQRGIYNEYALRTTPKEIVESYFIKEGNLFKLKPHLKQLVSFGQINLSDREQLRRIERSQIVFCRNVIIYFDDEMKKKVINAFYDNLEPGGALLIGHSESLHNISRAFQMEHHKGTIVYRKMA